MSKREQSVDTTSDTNNSSGPVSPNIRRRRPFFRSLANRLRIASHLSRARRADNVTDPDNEVVVDNHELYVRQSSTFSAPAVGRQISTVSRRIEDITEVEKDNRYILANGVIQFFRNFQYAEVRMQNLIYTTDIF